MALTRVGGDLLKKPLNIGAGVTITTDGNATFSGIVTAANFVDAAGNPITGGSAGAGLGTAVSAGSTVGGEQIYYTNTVLTVTGDLTIDPPDSSNIAYTQYSEIAVEAGYDLIVEDGDDLIPDILGIGTDQAPVLPGAGGRVRADQFTNKAGTGAPEFPNGALVSGDFTVTGSKTYLNSDNVEFKDKNIGISSLTNLLTDNQLHGAGFTIYGLNSDKTLTWDNPNSRMSFSDDLYAPNITSGGSVTAETSITVGDTFLKPTAIGIGATSTTGRNAGVGTAVGTIIYNATSSEVQVYKTINGWVNISHIGDSPAIVGSPEGLTATGGVISDYQHPDGNIYRSHVFATSGTFTVSAVGTQPATVDYLAVGGGGGGASRQHGGGGGAGLLRYSTFTGDASPGVYTITIGAGGNGGPYPGNNRGVNGGSTTIAYPGFGSPIVSPGGGNGGPFNGGGDAGGSGGGGGNQGAPGTNGPGGSGVGDSNHPGGIDVTSPGNGWGGDGGAGSPVINAGGGGGGGASGNGGNGTGPYPAGIGGDGADGARYTIVNGDAVYYAAGGGGGGTSGGNDGPPANAGQGGQGGGGNAGSSPPLLVAQNGTYATGSGGGAGGGDTTGSGGIGVGGKGGSGIVALRYIIGKIAAEAKATGGSISYYNGKTIHTFTSSGTFVASEPLTVEYVAIGGGGGGGAGSGGGGGGGGAGLFLNETGISVDTSPFAITVGGGGASVFAPSHPNVSARGNSTIIAFPSGTKTATFGAGGSGSGAGDSGGSGSGAGNSTPPASGGPGLGDPYPGSPGTTPASGWGHGGGDSGDLPQAGAGGGGGAGGVGANGTTSVSGHGGAGVQLPTAFRDPKAITSLGRPGPGGQSYWVAGGGGGGAGYAGGPGRGPSGSGGGPGGPYAGAGDGSWGNAASALANTGSGGGGTNTTGGSGFSGTGGSGLVIIAYPS